MARPKKIKVELTIPEKNKLLVVLDENRELRSQLKAHQKKSAFYDGIIEEIGQIVKPLVPFPTQIIKREQQKKLIIEDAVMHLSDEHADETVLPHTVQGLEDYNFPVACVRAEKYVKTVIDITQNTLANYRFPNLWILAYGDHTSGEIHGSVDRSYYKNQFRNMFAIGQMHALMFRDLAPYFENVFVVYVPGNHGRRSIKKDYHGAWDNWDYGVAQTAQLLCKDIKNTTFIIPDAFSVKLNIQNHNFVVAHGDDIKGWNCIPYYGMERKSRRLIALNAANGVQINYFVYGHFHTPSTLGDLKGETIINGSWKATDPYVFESLSSYTEPSQWLHGVHPDQGITWRYKIKLRGPNEHLGPQRYKIDLASPTID